MAEYWIGFRFHGYAKKYATNLIYDVSKKFNVKGVTKNRPVPHITLFGPFTTRYEKKVVSEVVNACKGYELVPFKVKGFGYFDNPTNKVIYLDIQPSKRLGDLRRSISERLLRITNTKPFDEQFNFAFHAAIALGDIDRKFDGIWEYIHRREQPDINQHLLRVAILKNRRILREYDLLQKRLLTRRQAKSRYFWRKTIILLKRGTSDFDHDLEETPAFFDNIWKRFRWRFLKIFS
jgi:2'-5' RNA ligase